MAHGGWRSRQDASGFWLIARQGGCAAEMSGRHQLESSRFTHDVMSFLPNEFPASASA